MDLLALLDESALLRPVGGIEVMRAQLMHLVEAASLPSVQLHVLPLSLGARPAMSAVFTVLSFEGIGVPDMAHVEHPMGAVHMDKPTDVSRATLMFSHLQSLALGSSDSVDRIREVVDEL